MKDILRSLLLVGIMSVSAGTVAEEGKLWPASSDECSDGPDPDALEYEYCQAAGGCSH